MWHHTAHAVDATRLFDDWEEAQALWARLGACPGLRAAVLMPNHLHLATVGADREALHRAVRAFAQWRNRRRGERGAVFAPVPAAEEVAEGKHAQRVIRYLHLNPCRARLVACPAAWPFSTHRDCLGLAATPVRERVGAPDTFHAFVSGDPSCAVGGTPYPGGVQRSDRLDLDVLAGAVSEWLRCPLREVTARGGPRRQLLGAALGLSGHRAADIARHFKVSRSVVSTCAPLAPRALGVLARMVGDPRFPGLVDGDPRLGRRH